MDDYEDVGLDHEDLNNGLVERSDSENEFGKDEDKEDGEPIKVEPKKRVVRNPRFTLNVERLKGPRGIHTVEEYYKDIKFKGKGHEREDMNNIMKRLQHWAHRLYPKFAFDDTLATVEKLGKKKQLQTHMERYRKGMLEEQKIDVHIHSDDEDNDIRPLEVDGVAVQNEELDEFDMVLNEQIEKTKTLVSFHKDQLNNTVDSVHSEISGVHSLTQTNPNMERQPTVSSPVMTEERRAFIEEQRRLAIERRTAKMLEKAGNSSISDSQPFGFSQF